MMKQIFEIYNMSKKKRFLCRNPFKKLRRGWKF